MALKTSNINRLFKVKSNLLTNGGVTPPFNTLSTSFDGIDEQIDFTQVDLTSSFTTSFWFKPINLGASFLVGRSTNSDYVWLRSGNQIRIRINFSTYTFVEILGNNINTGAWNHLFIVRGSGNNLTLYLNGATFSTSQIASGNHRLTQIGGVGTSFYDGNVDEVAFWDSDQSLNLNAVYNSGIPNDISSLSPLLWYRMGDSDVYPTISDNAGSNDATMQNMSASNFVTDVPI